MSDEKKHAIEKIVKSPEEAMSNTVGPGGIVTRLWYTILHELQMRPNRFEFLLNEYILHNQRMSSAGTSKPARVLTRGNLRRELLDNPSMTIRSFIRGIRVIKVRQIKLSVELTFFTGKTSIHSTSVDLGKMSTEEELTPEDVADSQ